MHEVVIIQSTFLEALFKNTLSQGLCFLHLHLLCQIFIEKSTIFRDVSTFFLFKWKCNVIIA